MRLFRAAMRVMVATSVLLVIETSALAADVRVIDGDTLAIGEVHYRLFGIDAPEAGQTCADRKGGHWPCGDEATKHLILLIGSGPVTCDDRGTDDYDRVLAVCRTPRLELNRQMIMDGDAWAFRRYAEDYGPVEDTVAATHVGIWQAATETPWDYRARRWEVAAQQAPAGCPIKGNISDNGRIYHAPWSPWYDRTKVSIDKGERWFCSEREALDAGWRAPDWGR